MCVCVYIYIYIHTHTVFYGDRGTQWLGFCATNRKVAGSIPDGVIRFFR
jgi:hypothetical protein